MNTAMFHHIKPKDNIDFFIPACRSTKRKTLSYCKDIPMEIMLGLVRYKEWKETNRKADESEYDDFKDEIKSNDVKVAINGESRPSSMNIHNYEM
jgi:hypothetical protein